MFIMVCYVPNIKKILKDSQGWKVSAVQKNVDGNMVWKKKIARSQHTLVSDKSLLRKIGLDRKDSILIIAGYYGDWADAIARAGCETTYSELSKSLVDYARRRFGKNDKIQKFMQANYVNVPKKEQGFDWTVTFEPVGINMGLPLAVVRSLLNRKGFKVIHYPRENKPLEKYHNIKVIASAYGAGFERKSVFINGIDQKLRTLKGKHIVTTVLTNDKARHMARTDLQSLKSNVFSKDSLRRLSKVSRLIDKKYVKAYA
jgi:hypothetical protein